MKFSQHFLFFNMYCFFLLFLSIFYPHMYIFGYHFIFPFFSLIYLHTFPLSLFITLFLTLFTSVPPIYIHFHTFLFCLTLPSSSLSTSLYFSSVFVIFSFTCSCFLSYLRLHSFPFLHLCSFSFPQVSLPPSFMSLPPPFKLLASGASFHFLFFLLLLLLFFLLVPLHPPVATLLGASDPKLTLIHTKLETNITCS